MSNVDEYLKGMARLLLRDALNKLEIIPIKEERYTRELYNALHAASGSGYRTGVRTGVHGAGDNSICAVIELPTGTVTFPMRQHVGTLGDMTPEAQDEAVRSFDTYVVDAYAMREVRAWDGGEHEEISANVPTSQTE